MDIKLLHAFLKLASEGHFGRVAAELLITQPALTQRIQALERYLGAKLFERTSRQVRLTSAGEILLPYARGLVLIEEHARRDLADQAAGKGGRLRLAYLSQGDMPTQSKIAAEFRLRYPRVILETSSGSSQRNLEQMSLGEVDAAFVAAPITVPDGIAVRTVAPYPFLVALPRSHRLAELDRVPVKALRGERMIISPMAVNPALVSSLRAWLVRHTGAKLNVVAEEPPDHAIESVSNLGCVAFVSARLSRTAPPGVVFKWMTPTPLIALAIAYLRDDPAPLLTSLLSTVDEVAQVNVNEIPEDSEAI